LVSDDTNTVNEQNPPPETTTAEAATPQGATDAANATNAAETAQSTVALETTADDALLVLQAKADEYLAGWQRERADFANYKRRVEREMRESFINGGLDAIKKVLPLVDDFERAVENVPQHLKGEPWLNGTELLLNKLHKLLTEYNVEVLDPLGEAFDPNRHQAIAMDDSGDGTSGHVTEVLQKGYVCGDRVLRPAMVRVAV